jgi:hypothetical protein
VGAGDWPHARLQRLPPLQRRQNCIQDALDVAVDIVIAEPRHFVAVIAQGLFSLLISTAFIIGRVSCSVELDDKFFLTANEVAEVKADRLLPNEFEPAERAVSKPPPKLAFSLGLVLAQPTRPARFVQT